LEPFVNRRRVTVILSATTGGLLAAAFLPLGVAAAEGGDGGGGGGDTGGGGLFGGIGNLLGGGSGGGLGGLLGGGGPGGNTGGDDTGGGGTDQSGPGFGDIINGLLGNGSDDPFTEHPFAYTGAASGDDDDSPPSYYLEAPDGKITDFDDGTHTVNIVQQSSSTDPSADDIESALGNAEDPSVSTDGFSSDDPDLSDVAGALANSDDIDFGGDDEIKGADVTSALGDAGLTIDDDAKFDADDIASALKGLDDDAGKDAVSNALNEASIKASGFNADDPSLSDVAAALADSDDTDALGGDVKGDDVTSALGDAGITIDDDAKSDAGDIASALNAADVPTNEGDTVGSFDAVIDHSKFLGIFDNNTELTVPNDADFSDVPDGAGLPAGTTFDYTDIGLGFENVYTEIPAGADGDGGGIQDILVTPFGDYDVTPIAEVIDLIQGDENVDFTDVLNDLGSAFGIG
jgi:hypothetical protein